MLLQSILCILFIFSKPKVSILCIFNFILEGKSLAASRDAKFIETSSGIQHNVDELLVGTLKQARTQSFIYLPIIYTFQMKLAHLLLKKHKKHLDTLFVLFVLFKQ